jgi:hypothetical protein
VRHRHRRPQRRLPRRGRRRPPRLAHPTEPGSATTLAGERRGHRAGARRRGTRRRPEPGVRLVGRRLLAGASGRHPGRRVLAHPRHRDLGVLAGEGLHRAPPRRLRGGAPRREDRPAAAGADLPSGRREPDPAAVHGDPRTEQAAASGRPPRVPDGARDPVPGGPHRRRRRCLPHCGRLGGPGCLQPRGRAGDDPRRRRSSRTRRARGWPSSRPDRASAKRPACIHHRTGSADGGDVRSSGGPRGAGPRRSARSRAGR